MASTTKTKSLPPEPKKNEASRDKNVSTKHSDESAAALRPSATRETIESIVVAFILAFLFKTFEAEAFVIPTGSMAPTLLGRHKDMKCPQCGFRFTLGASDEVESETDYLMPDMRIRSAVCPNCRYRFSDDLAFNQPVFKGDRILVTKFSYELADPKRWDTVVFKYPEEPKTNYIKRCVALPNETIEIRQGDLYRISENGATILHKEDPNKQRVLQQSVYDNDHPEAELLSAGWPERWAAVKRGEAPGAIADWTADAAGWTSDAAARSLHLPTDRAAKELRWIRYRNFLPDDSTWRDARGGRAPIAPKPKLIADFCSYNAYSNSRQMADDMGVYWVGDLTINCRFHVQQPQSDSQLLLELREGARAYHCRIEPSTGKATLSYSEPRDARESGEEHVLATAETRLKGAGDYDLAFANVDDRLCLWIDGRLIDFDGPTTYAAYGGVLVQRPWDDDLTPVGIAAQGAEVTVSHLLLQRDVYYRGDFVPARAGLDENGYAQQVEEYDGDKSYLMQKLDNPTEWFREYERGLSSRKTGPGQAYENISFQFTMGTDEFFMMGDNSPRSKDSRLWSNGRGAVHRHAVPRVALVGKAFFVYWPHGIPFLDNGVGYPKAGDKSSIWNNQLTAKLFYHQLRDGRIAEPLYPKLHVPFYPNFARMHRIR
jgi:signal peptidase I